MKHSLYFLILTCVLAATSFSRSDAAEATCHDRTLTVTEGLPDATIRRLCEDGDGFIWVATEGGLYRYDGWTFQACGVTTPDGTAWSPSDICCMADDGHNRLWLGTTEGLWIIEKHTATAHRQTVAGMTQSQLNCILIASDDEIYLGFDKGLVRYDTPTDSLVLLTHSNSRGDVPERMDIRALAADAGGLFVATSRDGLYRYDLTSRRFSHYAGLPTDGTVTTLLVDSRGALWIGTDGNGLRRAEFSPDGTTMTVETFRPNPYSSRSLAEGHIRALMEDGTTATLWVATADGVALVPTVGEATFSRLVLPIAGSDARGPKGETPCLMADRSGRTWLGGGPTGLYVIREAPSPFHLIAPRQGLPSRPDIHTTLLVDEEGACWAGFGYGIDYVKNSRSRTIIRADRPYHLSYSRTTGEILLSMRDRGLWTAHQAEISHRYRKTNSRFIPDNAIHTTYEDSDGNWWVGTRRGLGIRCRDGRQYSLVRDAAQCDSTLRADITVIGEDAQGGIWMIVNGDAVARVEGSLADIHSLHSVTYTATAGTLPQGTPLCFHADAQGRFWLGMEGAGLCCYDTAADKFVTMHHAARLPGDVVTSIEHDEQGRLWVGTRTGLACVVADSIEGFRSRTFTTSDGLATTLFHAAASYAHNGTLYFGGDSGIVHFRPDEIAVTPTVWPIFFTDVAVDGRRWSDDVGSHGLNARFSPTALPYATELRLPASARDITLRLAAPTVADTTPRLAYRIVGSDSTWHDIIAAPPEIHLPALAVGRHLIEVRATDSDGAWHSATTLFLLVEEATPVAVWIAITAGLLGSAILIAFCLIAHRRKKKRTNFFATTLLY